MTTTTPVPGDLRLLTCHPLEVQLPTLAGALLDAAARGAGLSGWRLAGQPAASSQGRGALDRLLSGDLAGIDDGFLELSYDSGIELVAARQGNGWMIDSMCLADRGEAAMRRWLAHALVIARHLVPVLPTIAAEVTRSPSAGGFFIPEPPIARMRHLWMTTDAEIAEYYGDQARAFERVWDETHPCDGGKVLVRALDRVTEPDWVGAVLDGQLGLARLAHPGQTRWRRAVLTDWNRRWLAAPQESLGFVGYDPAQARIEFTAMTHGKGLAIGELQMLHELRATGRDGSGRAVRTIAVVYLDADSAKPDLVPLTDLGITALCYRLDGGLVGLN